MHQFDIILSSFAQVQEFVNLAIRQPFDIAVGNEHQQINGKDLLGMFSLDYSREIRVRATCTDSDFFQFLSDARKIAENSILAVK